MQREIVFENADGLVLSRSPIVKSVSRVGSHADCEVVFSGLQPHALTVRVSNSGFSLSNRMDGEIRVGDHTVPKGKSFNILDGDRVNIQGLVWMRIQVAEELVKHEAIERDTAIVEQVPSPAPSPKPDKIDGFGIKRSRPKEQEVEKTNPILIAIALGMTVVVAALFLLQNQGSDAGASGEAIGLSSLKDEFAKLESSGVLPKDLSFQSLQAATSELRKGNHSAVRPFLIHLRDTCDLQRSRLDRNKPLQESLQRIIKYCNANI